MRKTVDSLFPDSVRPLIADLEISVKFRKSLLGQGLSEFFFLKTFTF